MKSVLPVFRVMVLLGLVQVVLWVQGISSSSYAQSISEDSGTRPFKNIEFSEAWFPEEIARSVDSDLPGWLPVYLEIENKQEGTQLVRIEGIVRLSNRSSNEEPEFHAVTTVEVSAGPPKKVFLYLRYGGRSGDYSSRQVTINGYVGDKKIYGRAPYQIDQMPRGMNLTTLSILVSGEKFGDTHNFFDNTLKLNSKNMNVVVDGVDVRKLPDDPLGYHSIRVLVLHSLGKQKLERAQAEAIRDWVYLGGTVILVPSKDGELFTTELAKMLLPQRSIGAVQIEENFLPGNLAFFEETAEIEDGEFFSEITPWKDSSEEVDWGYMRIDPIDPKIARPFRTVVSLGPGAKQWNDSVKRLYYEIPFGDGQIGVLTIDDRSVSVGKANLFLIELWSMILKPIRGGHRSDSSWRAKVADFQDSAMAEFIKTGLSPELGVWFIAGLVFIYLLLVGPGIYFFLKKINRFPWVVWLQPLIVIFYVGLIFLTGYLTKGVLTQTRALTLFHWMNGEPFAHKDSYLGVFSSDESRYRLLTRMDRWLRPVFSNKKEAVGIKMGRKSGDVGKIGSSIRDFRLDVWQTGVFATTDLIPFHGGVDVEEVYDPDSLKNNTEHNAENNGANFTTVKISNHSDYSIARGFLVVSRTEIYPVGALPPGAEITVDKQALPQVAELIDTKKKSSPDIENANDSAAIHGAQLDDPSVTVLRKVLNRKLFTYLDSSVSFIGFLDRSDNDIDLAQSSMIKNNLDILVVYR